eukprot:1404495-Pyramimonas_sp.AAC.1
MGKSHGKPHGEGVLSRRKRTNKHANFVFLWIKKMSVSSLHGKRSREMCRIYRVRILFSCERLLTTCGWFSLMASRRGSPPQRSFTLGSAPPASSISTTLRCPTAHAVWSGHRRS